MSANALGGTAVVMDRFDAEEFLALIERYRVTVVQVVPTMFVRLLKLPAEVRSRYDVSSLRCVIHAAAPCPVPVKEQMIEWFGPVIHEYYAGTEAQRLRVLQLRGLARPPGHGRPAARRHDAHLRRRLQRAARRRDGDDLVRGSATRSSTTTIPEKTASSRHPRGWTTLGDVGYLDADGFVYLTDRKSYMIISGGVNIYPQEAENVLITHEKVVDVAVFGVPHDEFGEEVKAVVQPVDDARRRRRGGGAGRRADPLLPRPAGRRQVPALRRVPHRAAPPPDRQAVQAVVTTRTVRANGV